MTYAKREATGGDDEPARGMGSSIHSIQQRTRSHDWPPAPTPAERSPNSTRRGALRSPATFAEFAGDLLVGNFGDGKINALNPATGALVGTVSDGSNSPLVNAGLWGLTFGNGGNGGDVNSLYFTAGGASESIGVFGRIDVVPEPACAAWALSSFLVLRRGRRSHKKRD